ncbi:hypothetical protein KI387_014713 [Taxus chinensis]|uniref:Uncharacterized protein n=1 Tax=Taxus chinensis TaxID=29808 RepID=A0AA38FI18_TAXCH|nr:hypothetical protein KI387_014713 [Taxus chinensis]
MAKSMEKLVGVHSLLLTKNPYTRTPNSNRKSVDLSRDAIALCKQSRLKEAISVLDKMDLDDDIPNLFTGNTLVSIYAKCGRLKDARRVLQAMPKRNVVSWTALIAASCKYGRYEEALNLFYQMQREGIEPNGFTFSSVLPAFANLGDLKQGKEIHEDIIRRSVGTNCFVGSALVNMYVKCGSIEDARQVFDKMCERNAVSWTVMIAGYAQTGQVHEASKLFERMKEPDVVSWTTMVAAYAQNGQVDKALDLFKKMPERDVVAWTAMISGCVRNKHFDRALDIFREMQLADAEPNSETFSSLLPACANLGALECGKEVHQNLIRSGSQSSIFVGSALIDMYVKCGKTEDACKVFDKMAERNVVTWNSMIVGYAQNGYLDEALKLFESMPERNVVSWNAMISGYAQNGQVDEATKFFQEMPDRDVVSWTAMIAAYVQNGQVDDAMKLFDKMPLRNVVSWNTMIAGYAQNGNVEGGMTLFQRMPERDVVSWNTMVAGLAQNGHVDQALKLFQEMPEKNVVSWTSMIAGYTQNGHSNEALKLFREMQLADVKPNPDTFASVIPACANLASLNHGKEIHDSIHRNGFLSDVFVESALVDMYAKCGSIDHACKVFRKMLIRDVVSWNTMITGYAMHGLGMETIHLFEEMLLSSLNPNGITFVGVLSACCHAGLVQAGLQYFDCMRQIYHITPTTEHFCCMVDLLGRAGYLNEAENFVKEMPMEPSATVWVSLLGACRNHTNVEIAERVANLLFHIDPKSATPICATVKHLCCRWQVG